MFCANCGKELSEGSRFCGGCGAACGAAGGCGESIPKAESVNRGPGSARQGEGLLGQLLKAHEICSRTNVFLENAAAQSREADALDKKARSGGKIVKYIAIGYVIFMCAGPIGFLPMSIFGEKVGGVIGSFLAILTGAMGIVVGVGGYRRERRKQLDRAAQLRREAGENQQAAQNIFEKNYADLAFLPEDYWYPLATDYLIKMLRSSRAADLPTALNLYDAQLHRWRVEEANQQIIAEQQAQTAHLKGIRTSSAVNAAASVANVAFNIARRL